MNQVIKAMVVLGMVGFLGCAERRPDPTKRPDFVDTTDTSKIKDTMKAPPKGR